MPNNRDALKKLMEEFKVRAAIQTKRQVEDKGKYLHELTKHEPINEADIARMRREMQFDKFKKGSADPRQFYHATTRQKADFTAKHALDESGMPEGGIRQFDPGWRGATFVTPDSELANTMFAHQLTPSEGGHIYPVHVQVKKPFDFENRAHVDELLKHPEVMSYAESLGLTPSRFRDEVSIGDWSRLEHPGVMEAMQDLGHDSFYVNEMGVKNLGIFDPEGKIKSSTGNRGTYDTTEYDITKKDGGEVHMEKGGSLRSRLFNYAIPSALTAGSDDPIDYATLFGSMKANVPAALMAYHGAVNENEDAELARRHGPAGFYTRSPGESFGTPLERPPVGGNDLSHAVNMQELREMNPHLSSMSPADRARAIKNYVDYKKIEAMSKPRYAPGGGVKKQSVDLARRGILGLRSGPKVEHLPALQRTPQIEITAQSLLNEPVSRRSVLQSGVGQMARNVLPMGEMIPGAAKAVNAVQQAAEIAIPRTMTEAMVPGLVAEGLKNGYSFPRIMKMVEGELGTGMRNINEADIERMYENLRDPYSATDMSMFPNRTTAGDAYRSITGVEGAFGSPLRQLRDSMRSVREADPNLYETLKGLSRDIEHYGYEP